MINSKRKGSKNEREVAHWLKEWTGFEFTRTPSSGGLRWKGREDVIGDIVCVDKSHKDIFPFSIEAKFKAEINFNKLLTDAKRVEILEFWDQCLNDAKRGNKIPLLFFRYNQMKKGEFFVAIRLDVFKKISKFIPNNKGRLKFLKGNYQLAVINSFDLKLGNYQKILNTLNTA